MAIQFVSVKCPECGANLPIEQGRKEMFCSYCGTKVIVSNDNEHIYRHVDEAGIKKAETEKEIALKRLEYAERKRLARENRKKTKTTISIIIGILAILFIILGIAIEEANGLAFVGGLGAPIVVMFIWVTELSGDADDKDDSLYPGLVRVPDGIDEYQKKDYTVIEALFRGAGFTNVCCVPLYDLWTLRKHNLVETISINGKESIKTGQRFQPAASVVITYHCKKVRH